MKMHRRNFLHYAALAAGVAGLSNIGAQTSAAQSAAGPKSKMKLGLVTYELAKDWDIDTIIKNCEATHFDGVELRTTHKHGVETSLDKKERVEVKKKFQDSKVELMGLGSAFDYHTPDESRLRKDIEATKEYITLAADVGASGVKVRPNAFPKEVSREKTMEQIGKSLAELGNFGAGFGVAIRLEVHGAETSFVPCIKTILDIANHPNVGACWNSNDSDLAGSGFDANFDLIKARINEVHMRDLFLENYPFRKLMSGLNQIGYSGYCLAEIPQSADPIRVMKYYRALWLAFQGAL